MGVFSNNFPYKQGMTYMIQLIYPYAAISVKYAYKVKISFRAPELKSND